MDVENGSDHDDGKEKVDGLISSHDQNHVQSGEPRVQRVALVVEHHPQCGPRIPFSCLHAVSVVQDLNWN